MGPGKYCAKTVSRLTFSKMHKIFLQTTPLTLQSALVQTETFLDGCLTTRYFRNQPVSCKFLQLLPSDVWFKIQKSSAQIPSSLSCFTSDVNNMSTSSGWGLVLKVTYLLVIAHRLGIVGFSLLKGSIKICCFCGGVDVEIKLIRARISYIELAELSCLEIVCFYWVFLCFLKFYFQCIYFWNLFKSRFGLLKLQEI